MQAGGAKEHPAPGSTGGTAYWEECEVFSLHMILVNVHMCDSFQMKQQNAQMMREHCVSWQKDSVVLGRCQSYVSKINST